MKTLLGITMDGNTVSVDLNTSHAGTHFEHNPKLSDAVKKVIPTLTLNKDIVRIDADAGTQVGFTDLVETEEGDKIIYALRPRRTRYSRFVKNKKPAPSNWMTLDFRKVGEKEYDLYTAFVGKLTPSFPGGDYLPEQSKEFWSNHALVWGGQEIVPGTETSTCPW